MELLAWKARVSTLWIFLGVGMLAAVFAMVMPANVLSDYISTGTFEGETIDETMLAVMIGLFCILPLAMAFFTLVLRDPIDRWANAIVGALAAVMWAWDLAEGVSKEPAIGAGPIFTLTFVIAGALIVWHAWQWPKPAEHDLRDRRPASTPEHRAAGMVS